MLKKTFKSFSEVTATVIGQQISVQKNLPTLMISKKILVSFW